MTGFFVTGTGTDVGKTIISAALVKQLNGTYFKPIQCGEPKDRDVVAQLLNLPADRILKGIYELDFPASPHLAAAKQNIKIDLDKITLPPSDRPLIIEGAGGLMAPLNDQDLMIDLIHKFDLPVILVASAKLGTINHTLLSLEALRTRHIKIQGVILNGADPLENAKAIEAYGQVKILAHFPDNVTDYPAIDLKT